MEGGKEEVWRRDKEGKDGGEAWSSFSVLQSWKGAVEEKVWGGDKEEDWGSEVPCLFLLVVHFATQPSTLCGQLGKSRVYAS